MSQQKPKIGSLVWTDLTVPNADEVQQFYTQVIGWKSAPHNMGTYHDFDIKTPEDDETISGICFTRGSNANLPAFWMMYIQVEDVDASVKKAVALGGKIIDGPRMMGTSKFACIQDPAGAYFALIS